MTPADLTLIDDPLTADVAAARAKVRADFDQAAARLRERIETSDRLWQAVMDARLRCEPVTDQVDAYLAHLRVVTS